MDRVRFLDLDGRLIVETWIPLDEPIDVVTCEGRTFVWRGDHYREANTGSIPDRHFGEATIRDRVARRFDWPRR